MANPYQDIQIDISGRITTPGKFEGERAYLPIFWEASLDGTSETTRTGKVSVEVLPEDITQLQEAVLLERDSARAKGLGHVLQILKRRKKVKFVERDDGFVVEAS